MSNDPKSDLKSKAFKLTFSAIIALIALSALTFLSSSVAVLVPGMAVEAQLNHMLPRSLIMEHVDFFTYLIIFIVALQIAVVFVLWNFRLFSGNRYIPIRSVLLYILTLAGTIYWQVKFFPGGVHFHSQLFVFRALALNAIAFILTTGVLISGMTKPRFATNLGFNFLLFVWLFYCAFPWYFERI